MTTSQVIATKSLTFPLRDEQRDYLIDLVAQRYLDGMDMSDLERFFFDVQVEYLREYNDEELLGAVDDVTDQNEYEEIVNEIG
jgi:hypothetical protein